MITQNTNPLIWHANSSMTPAQLPQFVQRVAEEGGTSLVVNGDYIDVNEVIRLKALVDDEIQKARMNFDISMSDISANKCEVVAEMEDAAFRAGEYYRVYIRYLNLTENPFGTPLLLSAHHELEEQFKRGFAVDPFAERDYN